jgi:hypothetical protein
MPAAAGPSRRQAEPPRNPPPFRPAREPEAWDEPPVLLVPDPIDANSRRKRWMRGLRWAAAILIVVTGAKLAGNVLRPSHPVLSERDLTSTSPAVPPAVVSPEESRRPESTLAMQSKIARPESRAPVQRAVPRAAPVVEEPAADTGEPAVAQPSVDSVPAAAPDSVPEEALQLAADTNTDSLSEPVGVAAGAAADTANTQPARDTRAEQSDLATRRAAAAALEELDRQRRRERANAATAALPPATRPDASAPAETAPRPLTLEQRAQIYLRIGLDEAVKHLGGPVHVIEGMTPELIGLTRTQLIPGSSSSRPVVRVVYLDTRGRLILLDQQRMVGDQAASSPAGSLRWSIGDVMLYLRGEPSPEVLRSLQARVR